jgi:hypothetical protein
MTDTTTPAPAPTGVTPAVVAALASAANTAAASIEASAVTYIQSLEAKAKTELGVVEGKLAAIWTKVKAYAPLIIAAAVLVGAGYVATHLLHI